MTHRRSFLVALFATVALLGASCTGTGESSGASGSTSPQMLPSIVLDRRPRISDLASAIMNGRRSHNDSK